MKQETITFDDRLSFTLFELTEQKVVREWYDKEDSTYCYQYFDFEDDDDTPAELSGTYIDNRIRVMTAGEFISQFECMNLSIDGREPLYVFYNETNNEIPYIGVYNTDDSYSVIGAKYDHIIGYGEEGITDMFSMLING